MPRPSNTEERRTQILDALLEVMSREGYARATIASIARSAGLAPGLIHYHFESKHEILVSLVERLTAVVEARIERHIQAAGASPRRRLEAILDAYVALGPDADPRAVAAWVVVGAEALREPEVQALYAAAIRGSLGRLRKAVAAVLRDEGHATRGAGTIAAALLTAIEGAYRVAASAPTVLPEGFAAPMLKRMAQGLLSAEANR